MTGNLARVSVAGRSALRERIRIWLRLATDRLGEAQQEQIWAVVRAYESGLSIS